MVYLHIPYFDTWWGNKNHFISESQLYQEEVVVFTGKIRSFFRVFRPNSLLTLVGTLGLVQNRESGSQSTILLTHRPFCMLGGTALFLILVEVDKSFSSDVSNCRTSI